jgi:hypothetical protein
MDPVVHELARAGITALVETSGTNASTYDVACIFWCQHSASGPDFENLCRSVLQRARRTVLVHLDGSPLPSVVEPIPRIRIQEAGHSYENDNSKLVLPEWQEAIKTFLPAIQFEVSELRRNVRDGVAELKSWLNIHSSVRRHFELEVSVRGSLAGTFAGAGVVASLFLLGPLLHSGLILVICFGLFLILWAFFVFPWILFSVDSVFGFRDIWERPFPVLVFGGSIFGVVWLFVAPFTHAYPILFPAALLVASWIVIFVLLWIMALGGSAAIWALFSVMYWLAKRFPAKAYNCFISYRSTDVSSELKQFIDQLEGELTAQEIVFYDGWKMRESRVKRIRDRSISRTLTSELQNSGFVLTFITKDYLKSRWCTFELATALALKRPTLRASLADLPRNALAASDFVSLTDYANRAQAILDQPTDSESRRAEGAQLAQQFRAEIYDFIARLCFVCHGHGTDVLYRSRFVPHGFRIRCSFCNGTGRRAGVVYED